MPYDAWGVEGNLVAPEWTAADTDWCRRRGFDFIVADSRLRPIRDSDGTDEVLALAGKPEGVTA